MALQEALVARLDMLIAKADEVLGNYHPPSSRRTESGRIHNRQGYVEAGIFAEWQSQSRAFLVNLLGAVHPYVQEFEAKVNDPDKRPVEMGQGILRAVKGDLEAGFLATIRALVEAELFSDLLDMATHLQQNGYHAPAASLTGAVLEDGLRKIAAARNLTVGASINALNHELYAAQVYTRRVMTRIQAWGDIRNSADHGQFDQFTAQDVQEMITGVRTFLADYLK